MSLVKVFEVSVASQTCSGPSSSRKLLPLFTTAMLSQSLLLCAINFAKRRGYEKS